MAHAAMHEREAVLHDAARRHDESATLHRMRTTWLSEGAHPPTDTLFPLAR